MQRPVSRNGRRRFLRMTMSAGAILGGTGRAERLCCGHFACTGPLPTSDSPRAFGPRLASDASRPSGGLSGSLAFTAKPLWYNLKEAKECGYRFQRPRRCFRQWGMPASPRSSWQGPSTKAAISARRPGEDRRMREPNFKNLLKVLRCEAPERPTLFEFFLNQPLYRRLAGSAWTEGGDAMSRYRMLIAAFGNAGYDYAMVHEGSSFSFPMGERETKQTMSLNEGAIITDRLSFEAYPWPEPDSFDYSALEEIAPVVPQGVKLIICGPGGVLENVIQLVGFDNLCFMLADDDRLAEDIFAAVGSRLVRHYELAAPYDTVGACISNDDWGFKTQTMLSPEDMRRYVFPWHKGIVEAIHAAGKPAILHSCGNLDEVMDDIIEDMRYDGKHSYQDAICPVEEAYRRWGHRIATLGGIDLDFICRSTVEEIKERCRAMLELSEEKGGYALGTGNSVPEYIDEEKYLAMVSVATEEA